MAWYGAAFEVKGKQPPGTPASRLAKLQMEDREPEYPDNPYPELVDILMDVGPFLAAPMGSAPLTSAEIMAWQQGTGNRLTPWEFQTIRQLSADYLGEMQQAADPKRPPPWLDTPDGNKRRRIAKHIRSILRE